MSHADRDLRKAGPRTIAIHAGETPDSDHHASSPNLVMSSTFSTLKPVGFSAHELDDDSPFTYTRWANPTVRMLEQKIAMVEGAEACACYATGMAAASAIFLSLLKAGDHLVVSDVSYAGIAELANDHLPALGIEVSRANLSEPESLEAAIRPNTKLIHLETPVNPLLRLTDIAMVCERAHAGGILVSADNTFATPVGTRPLELGVDLVMHSATKYLCGHGDAMGGAVVGARSLIQRLVGNASVHLGGVLSPFNAWLIARGMATLSIRMKAHEENAIQVAEFLESHSKVRQVNYPGIASHPQHNLARTQMENFSGMLSFRVAGSEAEGTATAERMAERLSIVHYAVSLGHHRSLIVWMPTASLLETSYRLDASGEEEYRRFAGDGVFRLSVGLEDAEDICRDLDAVL